MTTSLEYGALKELWGVIPTRRKRQLAAVFMLMLVGAAAELMTIGAVLPFLQLIADPRSVTGIVLVKDLVDFFGWTETSDLIAAAAVLIIVSAILSAILRSLLLWASQKFVYRLSHDLGSQIFSRMIRQPYGYYVQQNSSDILSGIEKINQVTVGILLPLVQGFTSAIIALFIVILLFVIDPLTATVAALSMGLLYIVISMVSRRALLAISRRAAAITTARIKAVQESLGGIRDIILDQSHPIFERRFSTIDLEFRDLSAKSNFISYSPRFFVEGAGIVLIILLALYHGTRAGGVLAAIPVLGALALGAQRLLPLLQLVYLGWAQYSTYSQSLRDVLALVKAPVTTALPRPADRPVEPFGEDIELRELTFHYKAGVPALEGINLSIRRGERVGFIGKTGSGKSTLLDVLMGLLEPSSGQVLLSGVPLGDENMQNWQAQIAHVPQAIFLSDDTIAANIAFGSDPEEFDIEQLRDAARRAGIHDFIAGLPEGYDTTIGERGIRLSGGQRQRIGIARALYKKATVLILDEATSALDDVTEAAVMDAIAGLDRNLTILMIAHRLSTIALCDTIVQLDDGRIVKRGSYQQVVEEMA